MRVELLFADGDPAAMPARQNLVEVLTEDAFETPIQMVAVASADDAELLGMRGTPIDPHRRRGHRPRLGRAGRARRARLRGRARADEALIRRAVQRARGWSHAPPR